LRLRIYADRTEFIPAGTAVKTVPKPAVREKTLDFIGASEGIRTLDVHLGKVMLYQTELRSQPSQFQKLRESTGIASSFWRRPGQGAFSF
jgi:hypothetical protein